MIRITSKRDGFRRCGIAHSKAPVDHPDNRFTEEEIGILQAEPMLTVEIVGNDNAPEMTVAEIKAQLDKLGVVYDAKMKKADLAALLAGAIDE
jgi:hypothetical protein